MPVVRSNYCFLSLAMLLAVGAGILVDARQGAAGDSSQPRVITAHEFVLNDSSGNVRGRWAVQDDKSSLTLMNAKGITRLALNELPNDFAGVAIFDKDGKPRGTLMIDPSGTSGVYLLDPSGTPIALMGVTTDASASIGLSAKSGKERIAMSSAPNGYAGLSLHDNSGLLRGSWRLDQNGEIAQLMTSKTGAPRGLWSVKPDDHTAFVIYGAPKTGRNAEGEVDEEIRLALQVDGSTPSVFLYDQFGTTRGSLAVAKEGGVGFSVYDRGGKPRGVIGIEPNNLPRLYLFNAAGRPVFSAP